jgi:hypothetical protein
MTIINVKEPHKPHLPLVRSRLHSLPRPCLLG